MDRKGALASVARTPVVREDSLAIGLIAHDLFRGIEPLAREFGLRLELYQQRQPFLDELERCSAALVLIDSAVVAWPCEICHRVRELQPAATLAIIAYFWSEREGTCRNCADVIVHRPVRESEWRKALRELRLPRHRVVAVS